MIHYLLAFLIAACVPLHAIKNKQDLMLCELETVANFFDVSYGLSAYKASLYQWDPARELKRARNQIISKPGITPKEFRQILLGFCQSTRDYHVIISFSSTESATLPFTVREAQNRYFIMDEDNAQAVCELINFDGVPVNEVVESLSERFFNCSNKKTDKTLATEILTNRESRMGVPVPQGNVTLDVAKDGELCQLDFSWDYLPELISFSVAPPKKGHKWKRFEYTTPIYYQLDKSAIFASTNSYVPSLGTIEWEAPPGAKNVFNGTIFHLESGERVGYIRISDFDGNQSNMKPFHQTINHLEQETQALLIDLTGNPGGCLFYAIALISSLIDEPIDNIQESLLLNQRQASEWLEDYIKFSGEDGMNYLKHMGGGYNFTEEDLESCKQYSSMVVQEWQEGKKFTTVCPMYGLKKIMPHPTTRYTKPIIVLVDELCFSSADILPAILQDNNQAMIFGQTTAGAGGCVESYEYPNHFGVDSITITQTVLFRKNGEALENIGVTPDFPYEITADDLQNGYQGYRGALLDAIQQVL